MAAGSGQFDIYQSRVGVTAVTNAVQRQILEALARNDLQLPDLVDLTGKAKSTLSSIHVRELLRRELVEELPHPSDSRRKIYRLIGRPMKAGAQAEATGAAVRSVPARPAVPGGLSLASVFQILAAAPGGSDAMLEVQARALGARYASRLGGGDETGFAHALTRFVEEERLARHLQLDFEGMVFRCLPGPDVSLVDPARMGLLLAAFATGAAEASGLAGITLGATVEDGAFLLAPNRS